MPPPLTGLTELQHRLTALGELLARHRQVWEERPFANPTPTWIGRWPGLADRLRALDPAVIEGIETEQVTLSSLAIEPLGGWIAQVNALTAVGPLPSRALETISTGSRRSVKARKWGQIEAMVGVAAAIRPSGATHLLDWCGGKGHLGRLAALESGLPVTHLDRQQRLCDEGAALDRRDGVEGRFVCADGYGPLAAGCVRAGVAAIGLHACGSLGERLLTLCRDRGAASVVLAPCCHHVIADCADHRPLSAAGRAHDLHLTRWNLRLITADEVVASPARRLSRRREMARRLAVDVLMRQLSDEQVYRPPGPLTRAQLEGPLPDLCALVAQRRGLALPPGVDWRRLQAEGEQRAHDVRALGLVRGIFRRALELWVDLDRACCLAEAGWQVQLGTFCPRHWTPRNLAIAATRAAPSRGPDLKPAAAAVASPSAAIAPVPVPASAAGACASARGPATLPEP